MLNPFTQMREGNGFIAALDQSGSSTPKTLERYGVATSDFEGDEDRMFEIVHQMRTRIMTNSAFKRPHVLGAILFEKTMQNTVNGIAASQFLWRKKQIVPFLKIDVGLADESNGVQLMKPIPNMSERLEEAKGLDVAGTKMRSVIKGSDSSAIRSVVEQQFEFARTILGHGMLPIVEPEVDIHAPNKAESEHILKELLEQQLDLLSSADQVVFKLTLPEEPNFYSDFIGHKRVARLAALSGGYSQEDSILKLAENKGMIASFSRALTEELRQSMTEEQFSSALDRAVTGISDASST